MPSRAEILADTLCDLVRELTAHRRGIGPDWLMAGDLADAEGRLSQPRPPSGLDGLGSRPC